MELIPILVCVTLTILIEAMTLRDISGTEQNEYISTSNQIQEIATEKLQEGSLVGNKKFILLNPSQGLEDDQSSAQKPVERNLKFEMLKVKRSSNVIEEENMATTAYGYKFTWRDTRLSDNTVFKNVQYNIL